MTGYLKKIVFTSIGVLVFSLALHGVMLPSQNALAVEQLSLGTSSPGGLFYNIGNPVAQCINQNLPEVNVTAEFTEGSVENLRLIKQKKMHLAVISPMIGHFARNGVRMFKGKPVEFKVVVRLLPNGNVWTVLKKNKDIKTIYDIKGKKVGVGTGGIGVMSRMQLAAHGIKVKGDIKPFFLQTGSLADALKDGSVDVSFLTKELALMVTATHDIRIIPWQDKELNAYIDKNPYFGPYVYAPNTFKGVDYEVQTVDNGIQLVCDASMSDDMVYKLAKAVSENLGCVTKIYAPAKVLNKEWVASKLGNPFHPGAIKYFKDAGVWKE